MFLNLDAKTLLIQNYRMIIKHQNFAQFNHFLVLLKILKKLFNLIIQPISMPDQYRNPFPLE